MIEKQTLIIIGIVLVIVGISMVVLNNFISEREFESKNTPGQLKEILGNCNCQADPERTCPQPFIDWQNSTHYIDNDICKYITLEEYNAKYK